MESAKYFKFHVISYILLVILTGWVGQNCYFEKVIWDKQARAACIC